jgi:hypothetical protein
VNGDTTAEPNETFFVDLTNPANATIEDGEGLGTIVDDDSASFSINDVRQAEGNSGTTDFVFTVTKTGTTNNTTTVDFATSDGTCGRR